MWKDCFPRVFELNIMIHSKISPQVMFVKEVDKERTAVKKERVSAPRGAGPHSSVAPCPYQDYRYTKAGKAHQAAQAAKAAQPASSGWLPTKAPPASAPRGAGVKVPHFKAPPASASSSTGDAMWAEWYQQRQQPMPPSGPHPDEIRASAPRGRGLG